jgi:hypothetical protein
MYPSAAVPVRDPPESLILSTAANREAEKKTSLLADYRYGEKSPLPYQLDLNRRFIWHG